MKKFEESCMVFLFNSPGTPKEIAVNFGKTEQEVINFFKDNDNFVPLSQEPGGQWDLSERGRSYLIDNDILKKHVSLTKIINKQRKIKSSFIFNDDDVLRKKAFTISQIREDLFAFGLFLPKEIPLTDGKGQVVGSDQKWFPVLISSDHQLLEPTKELEINYKVKIEPIPGTLDLRWSLFSIKNFLDKKVEVIDLKSLFEKIRNQYNKFVFFRDKTWYDVHALWDLGTYCFMLFNSYPILEYRGLKRTAKSKCMKISRELTLNATPLQENPSEASLFRETHDKRPTKYIDEAEKLFMRGKFGVEGDSRTELINASYSKGTSVPRVEKINNKFLITYYSCYSPTQIGSIRGLYGATEDRAITHIMTKNPTADKRGDSEPESETPSVWQEIRDQCYIAILQNHQLIKKEYDNFNDSLNVADRDLQLWKPLLVLAKIIDQELYSRIKIFSEKQTKQKKQDFIPEGTFLYNVLNSFRINLQDKTKVYVKDIVDTYKFDNPENINKGINRSISANLDKVGFKDFRDRDRNGAYFELTLDDFEAIMSPICPNLSSQSSLSSPHTTHDNDNDNLKCDGSVTQVTMRDNNDTKKRDDCDGIDDCDGVLDGRGKKTDVSKWLETWKKSNLKDKNCDFLELQKNFKISKNLLNLAVKNGQIMETRPKIFRLT